MIEQTTKPSRDNLIAFLDFAGEKGLLKKATAASYKKACNIILRILDETEAADLSKLDLDDMIARHKNIAAGRITPPTLKAYETRTRAAVSLFLEYLKDPSSWKPRTPPRAARTEKPAAPTREPKSPAQGATTGQVEHPSVHIDLQIHISPEASAEQIDQVFASMRRHLYGNKMDK